MTNEFKAVIQKLKHPWIGGKIIDNEQHVECKWPNGTVTEETMTVEGEYYSMKHPGRFPGDSWTSEEYRRIATIKINYNGFVTTINLSKADGVTIRLKNNP